MVVRVEFLRNASAYLSALISFLSDPSDCLLSVFYRNIYTLCTTDPMCITCI